MAVNAEDLCAIIETCHRSGVSSLKFGEVEVTFGTVAQTPEVEGVSHGTPHVVPQTELGGEDVSMALTSEQQRLIEDMEVVDMHISNPVAFENYSIDQLVNGGLSLDA